jgi:uncharacterized protein
MDMTPYAVRMGEEAVRRRLRLQAHAAAHVFGPGRVHVHIENLWWAHLLLRVGLRLSGLYRRGQANALRFECREREEPLPGLAPAMDGFRLLHVGDLHADFHPAFPRALADAVSGLAYDAVVMTGDYRMKTIGDSAPAVKAMRTIVAALRGPIFAVLGNHDGLEMAPDLEAMGVRVLLNEWAPLGSGADAPVVVGVDDPHFFQTDDLDRAMTGAPAGRPVVLLSHSPELYESARRAGVALQLSGHTHGGQVCLPGGRMVFSNARCPHAMARGAWRHGRLRGYTTRGAGCSGLDVRFNCPPELVVHRLRAP